VSEEEYMRAWSAAGRLAAAPHPRPFGLSRGIPVDLPPERNAVYIACAGSEVRYVGSTARGVKTRIREHVRTRRRAKWEDLWVIGLKDEISLYGVHVAEERVGRLVLAVENVRPPGR
jgi:hypothetical protein